MHQDPSNLAVKAEIQRSDGDSTVWKAALDGMKPQWLLENGKDNTKKLYARTDLVTYTKLKSIEKKTVIQFVFYFCF